MTASKVQCAFDQGGNLLMQAVANDDTKYPLPVPNGSVSCYLDLATWQGCAGPLAVSEACVTPMAAVDATVSAAINAVVATAQQAAAELQAELDAANAAAAQ